MNNYPELFHLDQLHYRYSVENKNTSQLEQYELFIEKATIRKGLMTAILGPSGCGKTTLLSLLGLLRKPQKGSLAVSLANGREDIKELWGNATRAAGFRYANIGIAMQRGELFPFLTVRENVILPLKMSNLSRQEQERRVEALLKSLYDEEEWKIFEQKASQVSQGQYQRAAVARALVTQPPILLADEPTGNLDRNNATVVLETLKNYITGDLLRSVVLVTHDLDYAIQYADDIFLLSRIGRLDAYFPKGSENFKELILARMSGID